MTRAYIKLDPGFPDRKEYYPDGPWRALVTLFCYAAHQPSPGTFKNEKLVKVILGPHARHLAFLLDERDVTKSRDGSLVVVGWVDWQEGSYPSVGARMDAIEKRRRPMTPAERAFVYRQRKKERDADRDASRDAQRDAQLTKPLRHSDSTQPVADATRLEKGKDGKFVVVQGGAA